MNLAAHAWGPLSHDSSHSSFCCLGLFASFLLIIISPGINRSSEFTHLLVFLCVPSLNLSTRFAFPPVKLAVMLCVFMRLDFLDSTFQDCAEFFFFFCLCLAYFTSNILQFLNDSIQSVAAQDLPKAFCRNFSVQASVAGHQVWVHTLAAVNSAS